MIVILYYTFATYYIKYYSRLRCLHATSPSTSGMVTRGASQGLSFWVHLWQHMDLSRVR